MTAAFAHEYDEIHRLIDRMPVDRVRALRAVAVHLVENSPPSQAVDNDLDGDRQRRLSFAGIMDADPDLASRSDKDRGDRASPRSADTP